MPSTSPRWCCLRPAPSKEKREYSERRRCMYKWNAVPRQPEESRDGRPESSKSSPLCERVTGSGTTPSPSRRGRFIHLPIHSHALRGGEWVPLNHSLLRSVSLQIILQYLGDFTRRRAGVVEFVRLEGNGGNNRVAAAPVLLA